MRRPSVRPWMVVSLMWIAPAILAAIDRLAQPSLRGDTPPSVSDLVWAGGDWLVYAFLTPIIFWIAGRWPIARPHLVRRTLLHLAISLLFCAAWALAGTVLRVGIGFAANYDPLAGTAADRLWRRIGIETMSWIFTTLPFGVVVYLGMVGMAHAIRYFVEAGDREVLLSGSCEEVCGDRVSVIQGVGHAHFY